MIKFDEILSILMTFKSLLDSPLKPFFSGSTDYHEKIGYTQKLVSILESGKLIEKKVYTLLLVLLVESFVNFMIWILHSILNRFIWTFLKLIIVSTCFSSWPLNILILFNLLLECPHPLTESFSHIYTFLTDRLYLLNLFLSSNQILLPFLQWLFQLTCLTAYHLNLLRFILFRRVYDFFIGFYFAFLHELELCLRLKPLSFYLIDIVVVTCSFFLKIKQPFKSNDPWPFFIGLLGWKCEITCLCLNVETVRLSPFLNFFQKTFETNNFLKLNDFRDLLTLFCFEREKKVHRENHPSFPPFPEDPRSLSEIPLSNFIVFKLGLDFATFHYLSKTYKNKK